MSASMVRLCCALVFVAAALAGCTKAENPTPNSDETSSSGELVEPGKAKAGSPERAVLTLVRYLQLNSSSVALDAYHPRVLAEFGEETVAEALSSQQGGVIKSVSKPMREGTRKGVLVTLQSTVKGQEPIRYAFILRNTGGRWKIIYDTILEAGLASTGQSRAADSGAKEDEAAAAARRATRRYRGVLFGADREKLP